MKINQMRAKYLAQGYRIPRGIILHDTAGSGTHNDTKYLANPGDGRKVSVDFTVERDGSVWQLNPDLDHFYTYHAGRSTQFKNLHNQAVTRACIGIEIVQRAKMTGEFISYPDEQVRAVAELCFKLCNDYNLTKTDITTHAKVITDGSRSDPRNFPWVQFWSYFAEFAKDENPELAEEVTYTVQEGDNLWQISRKFNTRIETLKELNDLNEMSLTIHPGQILVIKTKE